MNSLYLWLSGVNDFFSGDGFANIIINFLSFIPKIIYFLVACLLSVADFFQVAFRKLAGLDPIIIGGEVTTGDTIYKIISDALFTAKYPAINTAFWSIIVLGIFMLVVTSIIAVIRLEYKPDKDKGTSKAGVISSFVKAIFSFAIVPVACIFGMFLSNSLIGVIDTVTNVSSTQTDDAYQYFDQWTATAGIENEQLTNKRNPSYMSYDVFGINIPTNTEPFSGMVFKACAYNSNRFRKYGGAYLDSINASGTDLGIFKTGQVTDSSQAANIIDSGFAICAKMKGTTNSETTYSIDISSINEEFYRPGLINFLGAKSNLTSFSKYNTELVWYFYDLWTFNYIVAFVALLVIAKLYFNFTLALMARLFEIAGLFLFAPIPIALMPLDNGGALEGWRKQFVGKFVLLVVMVFGLNIISPLLTIFQEIKFFGAPVIDYIVNTLFIIAALNAVESLNKIIAGIIGAKDAYEGAEKVAGAATEKLTAGVGATVAAGRFLGTTGKAMGKLGLGATALGGRTAWGTVRGAGSLLGRATASHRGRVDARLGRRLEAENRGAIEFDHDRSRSAYDAMSGTERAEAWQHFKNTEQGREYRRKYGSDASAESAFVTGAFADGTEDDALKFIHSKSLFDAHLADGMDKSSAKYRDDLKYFAEASDADRFSIFDGKNMTARAQEIADKRSATADKYARRDARAERFRSGARKVGAVFGGAGHWVSSKYNSAKKRLHSASTAAQPYMESWSASLGTLMGTLPAFGTAKDIVNSGRPKKK